jgi:hypothetical protein
VAVYAEVPGRPRDPHGDLAPVGNQQASGHQAASPSSSADQRQVAGLGRDSFRMPTICRSRRISQG